MHPAPNILRSSVIGCVAKYELTNKTVMEEFFVNLEIIREGKGHIRYMYMEDFMGWDLILNFTYSFKKRDSSLISKRYAHIVLKQFRVGSNRKIIGNLISFWRTMRCRL